MFSSDTDKSKKLLRRWEKIYFVISMFCLVFAIIYEYFSHGVYSPYMMFAFAVPLLGGTLVAFLLGILDRAKLPGKASVQLYNSGIATLTVGSIFKGVLEIYGTTNRLITVYWIAGFSLLLIGICIYFIQDAS